MFVSRTTTPGCSRSSGVVWEQGKFPAEGLMTFSDVDRSDDAAHDAEAGSVIKPVLRIGAAT